MLSSNEAAYTVQGYVKRLTKLLLTTGQDTDGPAGVELGRLEHEYGCLHAVKMRVDPKKWSRFYKWPSMQDQAMQARSEFISEPDCFSLVVGSLHAHLMPDCMTVMF